MTKLRLALTVAAAVALVSAPAEGARAKLLRGTVGPGFTITLKTAAGKTVRTLKPGLYRIRVTDRSEDHDFHLVGPRVNRVITSTPFMGTRTITVRLRAGRYTYVCDPHAEGMRGTFRVRR